MKKIINPTNRVVCVAGKNIIPGESIDVSDDAAKTGSVKAVIRVNKLTVVDIPEATTETAEVTTKKKTAKKAETTESTEE